MSALMHKSVDFETATYDNKDKGGKLKNHVGLTANWRKDEY